MSQACLFREVEARTHEYPRVHREVSRRQLGEGWESMYAEELADLERLRPLTRGECAPNRKALYEGLPDGDPVKAAAPCPWVSCRFHLHADVEPITEAPRDTRVNMFGEAPEPLETHRITVHETANPQWTCVLDAVDALHAQTDDPDSDDDEEENESPRETRDGLMTDTQIAEMLGISDEKVRQIHLGAVAKLAKKRRLQVLR